MTVLGFSGKMDELLDLFELRAHRIISTANELLGHRVTS